MKIKIVLTVIAVLIVAFFIYQQIPEQKSTSTSSNSAPATSITYQNLAPELSKNTIIKAIPEGSTILLKFYNFDSGEREWEKSYILKKGSITEGESDAEIVLSLHSDYLKGLTNTNFCSVIQKANQNGDLGFETDLSKTALLWKFKSMMNYKECFGL